MPEPPIDDVGERMVAWAEAYRQRREALQQLKAENAENADKSAHTGVPHINPLSADLTADLKPISQRYKGLLWMREFTLEKRRDEIGKQKAEAYVLKPKINKASSNMERSVEDLLKFRRKRDQKIDFKKHAKYQEEVEECTFQPILAHCNRRFAIAHQHKVHDRLYTDASHRQWSLKAEQDAFHAEWKVAFTRKPNPRSRSPNPSRPSVEPSPRSKDPKVTGIPGTLLRKSHSTTSLPSRARGMTEEDGTPKGRRGPRASAAVLPGKEELQGKKSSSRRRRKNPDGDGSPFRKSLSARISLSTSKHSLTEEEEQELRRNRQYRPCWTGGMNQVQVAPQFKTLLEKCQPNEIDELDGNSRGSRLSTRVSVVSAR
jgi:hypothetical protein